MAELRRREPWLAGDAHCAGRHQRFGRAGEGRRRSRALVKRAPIYIFDDSFSALDFDRCRIARALSENTAESASIVTQRVPAVDYADQIVVLAVGRVVGIGTHAELLETCDTYREIAESQLSAAGVA